MPISDEELRELPTFRTASSIAIDLLARADGNLRRRISEAGDHAQAVREEIRRASERRLAEVPGRGAMQVQLFGMPVVATFSGQLESQTKQEVEVFRPNTKMGEVIGRIWQSAFDDEHLLIKPLPRMLHLNAALGIPPSLVHAQVFRGASVFEGRDVPDLSMVRSGTFIESARGPTAMVFLMLAYVASPTDRPAPIKGARPTNPNSNAYMQGWLAHASATPEVTVLAPMRFFDAVHEAQSAQLQHFLLWCARQGLVHSLDVLQPDPVTRSVRVEGWYQMHGQAKPHAVAWEYDSTWREPLHTATVLSSAEAAARMDPTIRGLDTRGADLPAAGSIH